MGGLGVRAAVAQVLVAAGMVLVVVAAWLLLGVAFALLVAGVLTIAYGLLLVPVPASLVEAEQTEQTSEPGVTPLGSPGASRAGR